HLPVHAQPIVARTRIARLTAHGFQGLDHALAGGEARPAVAASLCFGFARQVVGKHVERAESHYHGAACGRLDEATASQGFLEFRVETVHARDLLPTDTY